MTAHAPRIGGPGAPLEPPRRRPRRLRGIAALALVLGLAGGCRHPAPDEPEWRSRGRAGPLEIALRVRAPAPEDETFRDRVTRLALDRAEALAGELLAELPGSQIDVLNRVPMRVPIELSPAAATALAVALDVAEASEGAYDPTAGALRPLWQGGGAAPPSLPRATDLRHRLRRVDWSDVELSEDGRTAQRLGRRTEVDLGGVAVGAVLERVAIALGEGENVDGLVSSRGLHVVTRPGRPWSVGVTAFVPEAGVGDPDGPRPVPAARVAVSEGALAVVRPRRWQRTGDGHWFHEIVDPRSGRPARGARLALVQAASAERAAAAARALFVLGDQGPAWLARQPGLAGAGVLADGRRWSRRRLPIEWVEAEADGAAGSP